MLTKTRRKRINKNFYLKMGYSVFLLFYFVVLQVIMQIVLKNKIDEVYPVQLYLGIKTIEISLTRRLLMDITSVLCIMVGVIRWLDGIHGLSHLYATKTNENASIYKALVFLTVGGMLMAVGMVYWLLAWFHW